jgi:hypothetical protein
MHSSFTLGVLLVVTMLLISMLVPPATRASTEQYLPVGSWWTVTGSYHWTTTGLGGYSGSWTQDENLTDRFSVLSHTANSTTISWHESESWSSTATGTWIMPNGGETSQGTQSMTVDHTIDTATFKVIAVSDKYHEEEVGHPAWFLMNPKAPSQGSTVMFGWYVPSTDARNATLTDVPWSVGKVETINIKGTRVSAWSLTYTGEHLGYWQHGGVCSKGRQTITMLFDANYGIFLRLSTSGNFSFASSARDKWNEASSATRKITDTNLTLSVPAAVKTDHTQTYVTLGAVAGVLVLAMAGVAVAKKKAATSRTPPVAPAASPPLGKFA